MIPLDEVSLPADEPLAPSKSIPSPALARRLAWTLGAMSAFGPPAIDMYLPAFPRIAQDLDTTIGPIVSPFLGSLLLTCHGWRAIFWTITIFGGLCAAAVVGNVPETLAREDRRRGPVVDVLRGYGRILSNRRFLGPALAIRSGWA